MLVNTMLVVVLDVWNEYLNDVYNFATAALVFHIIGATLSVWVIYELYSNKDSTDPKLSSFIEIFGLFIDIVLVLTNT